MTAIVVGDGCPTNPLLFVDNLWLSEEFSHVAHSIPCPDDSPFENVFYPTLTQLWRPSATGAQTVTAYFTAVQSANYFLLFGSNMDLNGTTVTLSTRISTGDAFSEVFANVTAVDDGVLLVRFDPIAFIELRLDFVLGADSYIATIQFGTYMEIPRGVKPPFTPPHLAVDMELKNVYSEYDVWLGNIVAERSSAVTYDFPLLEPGWVHAHWPDLMRLMARYPFYLMWSPSEYPDDIAYCSNPKFTTRGYDTRVTMQVTFSATTRTRFRVR